jgi:chemotaxis methyl-accepting protein methylase
MFLDRYRHISFFGRTPSLDCTPPRLSVHVRGRSTAEDTPVDPEAAEFFDWLLRQAGVEASCYRQPPLARRLRACLRALRVRTVAEARARLTAAPEQAAIAISTMLIGVTGFFRDPQVFAYLDGALLPRLPGTRDRLRVWSAGCSDGSELYSVALLLHRRGLLEVSHLLGTDCRKDALRQARRGWFDRTQMEGVDAGLRARHFLPVQRGWRIEEPIRYAVGWQQANLLDDLPAEAEPWDLIVCRNVAIYLQPGAASALWSRLAARLREGGVLVVGKAERPPGNLGLVRLAPCVFQRPSGVAA